MKTLLLDADDVLRARGWPVGPQAGSRSLARLGALVVCFGTIYGAVMGSFGGWEGQRILQVCFSAIKVPILLTAAFVLSLPSFFVINTLAGLRSDLGAAIRALVATQAGLTIILASLAPLTAVWYLSFAGYGGAVLFNTLMFATASVSAQCLLRRLYRPLIRRNPRHRLMAWTWLAIYGFIGVQMAWVLRPFVGDPNAPVGFLRKEAWGNAYVKLFDTVWSLLGG